MAKIITLNPSKVGFSRSNYGRVQADFLVGEVIKTDGKIVSDTTERAIFTNPTDLGELVSLLASGYQAGCAYPHCEEMAKDKDAKAAWQSEVDATEAWILSQVKRDENNVVIPIKLVLSKTLGNPDGSPREVPLYLDDLAKAYRESCGAATHRIIAGNRRSWAMLALRAIATTDKAFSYLPIESFPYQLETYSSDAQRHEAAIAENAFRRAGARDLGKRDLIAFALEINRKARESGQVMREVDLARRFGLASQGADRQLCQVMGLVCKLDERTLIPAPWNDPKVNDLAKGAEPFDLAQLLKDKPELLGRIGSGKSDLTKALASNPSVATVQALVTGRLNPEAKTAAIKAWTQKEICDRAHASTSKVLRLALVAVSTADQTKWEIVSRFGSRLDDAVGDDFPIEGIQTLIDSYRTK
jgi:hypothetical protein